MSECITNGTQCDSFDPCTLCPRRGLSPWQVVGCNRGTFNSKQAPIRVCPQMVPGSVVLAVNDKQGELEILESIQENLSIRAQWVASYAASDILPSTATKPSDAFKPCFQNSIESEGRISNNFKPLLHCTLEIIWEFTISPCSEALRNSLQTNDFVCKMLLSAARYQSKTDNVLHPIKRIVNGADWSIGQVNCAITYMPASLS